MQTFRKLLKAGTVEEERSIQKIKLTLADACLTAIELGSDRSCYLLYSAITHLAHFKELHINPGMYEDLLYSVDQNLDPTVYNIVKKYFISAQQLYLLKEDLHYDELFDNVTENEHP